MPPRRRAPLAEQTPRLDVRRLILKISEQQRERAAGQLRIRFGLRVRYQIDLRRGEIHLRIEDMPWWRYVLVGGRSVRCNTCRTPTELLYWVPQRADAAQGEGRCAACCGVRWQQGYLTGARASTGRLQPQLRRELRAGNIGGVIQAMKRGPREWLAGRQALEDEGMLPRHHTLEDGNRRRWMWRKKS